jgi:hypothetical protein
VHLVKILLLIAILNLPAGAQMAEPSKIRFRSGTSSAVVRGRLAGRQDMEYAVYARSGQLLSLQLSTVPNGSLELTVLSPSQLQTLTLEPAGPNRWKANLPQDGDYEIWVIRVRNIKPVSSYQLRITIR